MDTVAFYNLLLSELAAGSIQDIIKAAADYTHQHITVLDLSYNVLAMYPKEAIGDPYWDPQFHYGYVPEYNMKKIFENKYPDATFAGVSSSWEAMGRRCARASSATWEAISQAGGAAMRRRARSAASSGEAPFAREA